MQFPPSLSQDETMADIFGISPEEFRASVRDRKLVMESLAFRILDAGEEALDRWRSRRPGLKTRT